MEILQSVVRFKIVVAGRRFGKSYLSAVIAIVKALQVAAALALFLRTDPPAITAAPTDRPS
jgi:hypothetical protein